MNNSFKFLCVVLFFSFELTSQKSDVTILKDEAMEGLTFFCSHGTRESYLINNCGDIINMWEHDTSVGLSGRLLPNGNLIRAGQVSGCCSQFSKGGLVEIIDWDGNVIWSYAFANEYIQQHHDFAIMPNGNLLILGWEPIPKEWTAFGIQRTVIWSEFIYEVKPIGLDEIEIIWEWHLSDHFVQDVNNALDNFGVIKDNPGKVDFYYRGPSGWIGFDFWHANAIDYNSAKDEILINARNANEMWIIDHSTTTAEAKTDFGGNKNKGGQLLFRWGNPAAFDVGIEDDINLFGAHGHHWIQEGFPNEGKILYYNNGTSEGPLPAHIDDGSRVEMIDPSFDDIKNEYEVNQDGQYVLSDFEILYGQNQTQQPLYSKYMGYSQQLENGNLLIVESQKGRIFEINALDEIVWEYAMHEQGSSREIEMFRAYKYPMDFKGFEGRDLTPIFENAQADIYSSCQISDVENLHGDILDLYPNPFNDEISVKALSGLMHLGIYNLDGMKVKQIAINGTYKLDLSELESGMYIFLANNGRKIVSKRIVKL